MSQILCLILSKSLAQKNTTYLVHIYRYVEELTKVRWNLSLIDLPAEVSCTNRIPKPYESIHTHRQIYVNSFLLCRFAQSNTQNTIFIFINLAIICSRIEHNRHYYQFSHRFAHQLSSHCKYVNGCSLNTFYQLPEED